MILRYCTGKSRSKENKRAVLIGIWDYWASDNIYWIRILNIWHLNHIKHCRSRMFNFSLLLNYFVPCRLIDWSNNLFIVWRWTHAHVALNIAMQSSAKLSTPKVKDNVILPFQRHFSGIDIPEKKNTWIWKFCQWRKFDEEVFAKFTFNYLKT